MPHPVDLFVGERVRSLRAVRGLSRSELAEKLGNSFQQVQKYEHGANRISASKLYTIAKIMKVKPNYFFEGLDNGGSEVSATAMSLKAARIGGLFDSISNREIKSCLYNLIKALST